MMRDSKSHNGAADALLQVPPKPIQFDGRIDQAIGVDLPIVAINLDHRTDRWERLVDRMATVGLSRITRAPAIEGIAITDSQAAAIMGVADSGLDLGPKSHLTLTRRALGCYLSHLSVWDWVSRSGLPYVLIFEDDTAPLAHFDSDVFCRIVRSVRPDTGPVMFGTRIMGGLADTPTGADLARLFYFTGTFAYLVTPATCRVLIDHLLPPRAHVDHQISKFLVDQRETVAAYYTTPQFFESDWSLRSDIYTPLSDENAADTELGRIIDDNRVLLLAEGRPLLPLMS